MKASANAGLPEGIQLSRRTKPVEISHPATELRAFANHVGVAMTAEEFSLLFATLRQDEEGEADGVATVYLTPPLAKRVLGALQKSIAQYEGLFGEIQADPTARLLPNVRAGLGLEK